MVFLKGCSLACQWCSNPECISARPEIGFFKSLCTRCGKCVAVCPNQALQGQKNQMPVLDRAKCSGCKECAAACYYKALVVYGRPMSAEEAFDAVKRDAMFYRASGGGVTVSGGEALLHPQFVRGLFEFCRQGGIHTCVETAGYVAKSSLQEVLPYTDLVLYDLKHLNSDMHRRFTGRPNKQILENAQTAARAGVNMLFRMPLIPGINDDEQNVTETADFLKGMGRSRPRIELMPYHRLGKGKYESLDMSYPLAELPAPDPEQVEQVKGTFEKLGITCTISK